MSDGPKPIGRLTVRNAETKEEVTVGTLWPLGDQGNMSLTLGQRAYVKDGETVRPELTAKQALDHLFTASKPKSGRFINCRMAANDKPKGERGARTKRQEPEADEGGYEVEELPF